MEKRKTKRALGESKRKIKKKIKKIKKQEMLEIEQVAFSVGGGPA